MDDTAFFKEFELLSDTPNAVGKIKELVLNLAIRGKLIPQVQSDESGSLVLRRIVEHGKQAQKGIDTNIVSPFDLPNSWAWASLGNVCSYIQRGKSPDYVDKSDVPVVSQKCVQWEGFLIDRSRFINVDSLKAYGTERYLKAGDLLWNSTGHGTVGRVAVFSPDSRYKIVVADSHVTILRPALMEPRFIWCWLASTTVQNTIDELVSGSTKQTELATSTVLRHPIPVPPLAEQKRIVAKVDELMALCDELETRQQARGEVRAQLQKSALHHLVDAYEPKSFAIHWQRVRDNFHLLHETPESVPELRQIILQLAVQGRLVRQDPKDAPADSILSATHSLFQQLASAKKLSTPKLLPPIQEEDVPFPLPSGWAWCRLGQLIRISSGDGLTTKEMKAGSIPVYGGNGVTGYHNAYNVAKRTLVIGRVGFYCGSIHVTPQKAWVTDNAFISTFDENHVSIEFLSWLLKATDLRERDNATAQPVISGGKVYPIVLGVPPLAEQKRIVAKVDELMRLCDELEAKLAQSNTLGEQLLDSTVHHLLAL